MQVPKRIKEAIIKCANYNNKANHYENIIYKWLQKNKLTEETASHVTRNMNDSLIDLCKLGCNPYGFIEILENLREEK